MKKSLHIDEDPAARATSTPRPCASTGRLLSGSRRCLMVPADTSAWVRLLSDRAPYATARDGPLACGEVVGHDSLPDQQAELLLLHVHCEQHGIKEQAASPGKARGAKK